MLKSNTNSSLWGAMIIAGSAIGAGIFSLPIAASGMWTIWSFISLGVVWYTSYLSTLMLLELNTRFEPGASINTITKQILGKWGSVLSGVLIAFLLYILLYAYFSAFGNSAKHIVASIFPAEFPFHQGTAAVLIGLSLGAIISWSSKLVGRLSAVLIVAMVISFVLSVSGLTVELNIDKLIDQETSWLSKAPFVFAGLPYFLSACAFTSMVPSLYKYYGKNYRTIKRSLLYGALISLVIYLVWLTISFGVIPREQYVAINAAGGNMGDLVKGFTKNVPGTNIQVFLNLFSNFAIISSFLGVGLSLFDYLADLIPSGSGLSASFKIGALTFLPPALASFFFPHGFIKAIGFAGFVVVILFFILPFIMLLKTRSSGNNAPFQMKGGKVMLFFVLLVSLIVGASQLLSVLEILPKY